MATHALNQPTPFTRCSTLWVEHQTKFELPAGAAAARMTVFEKYIVNQIAK
jgi:hypothetical protein